MTKRIFPIGLLVILLVVSLGCSSIQPAASIEEVEAGIFKLVNEARAGSMPPLPELERTSYLDGLAAEYADSQCSEESRQSSDIRFLLTNSWYVTYDWGNTQLSTDTAEAQVSYCLKQQDMKDAIYRPEARATGIGIASIRGVVYYVQIFDVVDTSGGDDQPIRLYENLEATDPTWEELKTFLKWDLTDAIAYQDGQFICGDFAETLHNNAEREGIRAAYVFVGFKEGPGHALNAFAVDGATVFIDVISGDKVAYIEVGKSYGVIALDEVDEFSYSYFETYADRDVAKEFSYSYFEAYADRVEQYFDDSEAYSDELQDYEDGGSPPDGMSMEQWYTKLSNWYDNLVAEEDALGIGETYFSPTESLVDVDDPTVVYYYVHW